MIAVVAVEHVAVWSITAACGCRAPHRAVICGADLLRNVPQSVGYL